MINSMGLASRSFCDVLTNQQLVAGTTDNVRTVQHPVTKTMNRRKLSNELVRELCYLVQWSCTLPHRIPRTGPCRPQDSMSVSNVTLSTRSLGSDCR